MTALRTRIQQHEGFEAHPYTDTQGYLTIGYGRNLVTRGITQGEAELLLDHDLAEAEHRARQHVHCFEQLNVARQGVVIEMIFQLGIAGFLRFTGLLGTLQIGAYDNAAEEMLDSLWARQTRARAERLAMIMRSGEEA